MCLDTPEISINNFNFCLSFFQFLDHIFPLNNRIKQRNCKYQHICATGFRLTVTFVLQFDRETCKFLRKRRQLFSLNFPKNDKFNIEDAISTRYHKRKIRPSIYFYQQFQLLCLSSDFLTTFPL